MLASAIIIVLSVGLFGYWLRYTCLLLLKDPAGDSAHYSDDVIRQFSFQNVKRELESATDLDALERALQRDYRILSYLVGHTAGLGSIEDRLLVWDYRLLDWQYRVTRTFARSWARQALAEMATVLGALVRKIPNNAGAGI
jgi:hypothetical protein